MNVSIEAMDLDNGVVYTTSAEAYVIPGYEKEGFITCGEFYLMFNHREDQFLAEVISYAHNEGGESDSSSRDDFHTVGMIVENEDTGKEYLVNWKVEQKEAM